MKKRFPDSLVLLFAVIVAAQVATYVLPAGEFERQERRVLPGTYHKVEADRLPLHTFLTAIPKGLEEASDIIFFVFIVGGVIGILRATGALDALLGSSIRFLGRRPVFLVGGMLGLCAVGSSTIGMAEEYMPFIPLLVTLCIALRMDAIVAMAIVYVGAGIGYGCAAVNPFTVLIGQEIAGLPLTSGALYRWALLGVCFLVSVHHVMRYASRVRANAGRSFVHDVDYSTGFEMPKDVRPTVRRMLVLATFVLGIGIFVYGVAAWHWYLTELAGVFLGMGLLAAVVAGLGANRTAREFCNGATELATTAILIGFARTIGVVLTEGRVIDTVIHAIATPLEAWPPHVAAVGMLAVQSVCNLFIPSGSGQAFVTMPIMAPLADLTGVTRQTAVLAYQFGDGFTNTLVPTNALLMGMLGLGRIPYTRWLRFILPLLAKLYVIAILALLLAVQIGYG